MSRAIPRLLVPPDSKPEHYTALPLEELGHAIGRLQTGDAHSQHNGKVRISIVAAAVCILSARIELYRRISKATECTVDSVEIFLPFLLALYDAVRSQRTLGPEPEERPDSSMYDSLQAALGRWIVRPRTRFLFPMFLLSSGCYLAQGLWSSSNSTYICPIVVREPRTIPMMQISALALDVLLAIIVYETTPKTDGRGLSGRRCVVLWSSAMAATSIVWSVVASIVYTFKPEYRNWLLFLHPPLDLGTFFAIGVHVLLFCLLCISTLHCVSLSSNSCLAVTDKRRLYVTAPWTCRRTSRCY